LRRSPLNQHLIDGSRFAKRGSFNSIRSVSTLWDSNPGLTARIAANVRSNSRSNQQYQSQRHFRNHQRRTRLCGGSWSRRGPSNSLMVLLRSVSRGLQRWNQAKQDPVAKEIPRVNSTTILSSETASL
jgi:hypothetical protein